jgi:hypothetical protein
MDPNTSNDQLDGDLINKSFSALPTTFVSGRLAGNYHLYYPEYIKRKSRIRGRKTKILPRKSDYESY